MRKTLSCPLCGGGVERIVSGEELYVDSIEGE
ncbi:hydrogenase maturation nickel metallochaperone HypA [Thermanaerosceptrum fracticalcis]|nr:hydrogenase maturation nickel metallochaperone HypA [Thermanaerosceptrum fracticalcis]